MLERLKFWRREPTYIRTTDLTPEQLAPLVESGKVVIGEAPLGDGKAEFLGEGSPEEFEAQEKADRGFGGIFGL